MAIKKFVYDAFNVPLWIFGAELARRRVLKRYREVDLEYSRREMLASSPVARDRIVRIGKLLSPRLIRSHSLVRVGAEHDGGYVFVDDFSNVGRLFSLGIGREVSADEDFARRGIDVYQYDHTVEGPPISHDRFHFEKTKVSPYSAPGEISLEEMVSRNNDERLSILKIDIEGDEWSVFDVASIDTLSSFSQIVCEFHSFSKVLDNDWNARAQRVLEKLAKIFDVVHVHGNNAGAFWPIGGVPFPDLIEITYANKTLYDTEAGVFSFPTSLDAPNRMEKPDLFLGSFKFESF